MESKQRYRLEPIDGSFYILRLLFDNNETMDMSCNKHAAKCGSSCTAFKLGRKYYPDKDEYKIETVILHCTNTPIEFYIED